jgi:hypothetical protein
LSQTHLVTLIVTEKRSYEVTLNVSDETKGSEAG